MNLNDVYNFSDAVWCGKPSLYFSSSLSNLLKLLNKNINDF